MHPTSAPRRIGIPGRRSRGDCPINPAPHRTLKIESAPTLAWLDASRRERDLVLDLVAALNEPSTLDELGIGPVRNAIGDALFPGTSTLQTRARYFLFLPWILQMAESSKPSRREQRERDLQLRLCQVLQKTEGPGKGVIGLRAGAGLRRWPTSIYWGGLMAWKIWRDQESPEPVIGPLKAISKGPGNGDWSEADGGIPPVPSAWADLPPPPRDFPACVNFQLTVEEAKYLRERVEFSNPQSYVAHLLRHASAAEIENAKYPWCCPAAASAPTPVKTLLEDARNLSLVHSGATILYNLMLADANRDAENTAAFTERLEKWSKALDSRRAALERWDRIAMWSRVQSYRSSLRPATISFVNDWYDLAVASPELADRGQTRRLLHDRELALKGRRARLSYADARQRHGGYGAWGPMTYRWGPAKRILLDIVRALG